MGLGKTVQAIALVKHLFTTEIKPVMIIVPVSTLFNWAAEFERFAPDVQFVIHRGADRIADPESFKRPMVVLTSYHTMRNDIKLFDQVEF